MTKLPNLLIVEDKTENLVFFESVINKIKINSIQVSSLTETLEKIQGKDIALSIIDIDIKGLNANELIFKINKENSTKQVPHLFLTAKKLNQADILKGYESGAVDFIFMPVDECIFQNKIKIFLDLFTQRNKENIEFLKENIRESSGMSKHIKKREANFLKIFNQSPLGSLIVGLDTSFIRCNAAFCNFLAYSEHELKGKKISDITYTDDLEIGRKEMEQMMRGEIASYTTQKRYIRKDGNIVWGEINICLVRDANNQPLYFLPVIQDITERKQTEEALNESRELYRDLIELAVDGILVGSNEGIIIDANSCVCQMTGKRREEIIGKHISHSLFTEESLKRTPLRFDLLQKGEIVVNERNILRSDGSEITVEMRTKMMPNGMYQSFFRDITERKRMEEELRKSREQFSFAMDASNDGLWDWDVPSGKVYYSPGYFRILGYQINEFENSINVWKQLLHPEDRDKAIAYNEACINNVIESISVEFRMKAKDGSWKWLLSRGKAVRRDENGKALQLIGTHMDITDRKLAEEALKINEIALNQQNDLFTSLLKNLQIGVFMVEVPSGKPLVANETACKLLGRGILPDANKSNLSEVYKAYKLANHEPYPPDEMPIMLGMSGKSSHIDDMIVERPDGSEILLEIYGSPVTNKQGDVLASLVSFIDITERKQAEKLLIESRERYRELIELAVDGVLVGSDDGVIIDANTCMCAMTGKKREEIIGKHMSNSFFTPERMKQAPLQLKQLIKGEVVVNEQKILRPDGSQITIEMRTKMMPDGTYQSIYRDITKRIKAQEEIRSLNETLEKRVKERTNELQKAYEALRLTEEKYRTVADYTYSWEYWINPEGNFNYISPSCERITGYKAEEFINDPGLLEKIIYKQDAEYWKSHSKAECLHKSENKKSMLCYRVVTKTGSIRWIDHTCKTIYSNGKYLGIRSSNRDITDKIEVENELLKVTVEVEERERNRFARELHDGMGPLLSTIKLYFQWLSETNNVEKIKIITEKGNHNIEKAIQTTREVAYGLSTVFLNKSGYVDAILNFTQNINELNKININFAFNLRVRFNNFLEITLYRITTELIKNTLTYANASNIEIVFNYDKKKKIINIKYSDNGIGFDLAKVKKMGKGLGLMNIQQRIKIMRGRLRIVTGIDKGLKVYIKFPVNRISNEHKT